MQRKLIIIGVRHSFQCGIAPYTDEQIATLKKYVSEICESKNIQQIAEEMTEDALEKENVTETIFSSVAISHKIAHEYIDINNHLRSVLGIDDYAIGTIAADECGGIAQQCIIDKYNNELTDTVRKRVWYAKLLFLNKWPTLLICGVNHVNSLANLCNKLGHEVHIEDSDYKS